MPNSVHSHRYRQLLSVLVATRRKQDLTQAELGRRIGKNQPFVSKFEHRVRRLDVIEFVDVCEALGIDPSALLRRLKKKARDRS